MPTHDAIRPLSLVDRLLAAYERTGALPAISGGDHEDDANDQSDEQQDQQHDEPLGDAGKRALDDERKARRDAEKRARDAEKKLADAEAERQKAKDAEAAEQGKWKELAEQREADLTDTTTKLTAATGELETLRAYVTADLDTVAKAVKDAAKDNAAAKILLEFHPGEDAATADLIAWTKRAKAQMPELTKATPRGNGGNPPPKGTQKAEIPSPLPKNRYM